MFPGAFDMKHTHEWTNWMADYLNIEVRMCKICQKKESRPGKPIKEKK